MCRFVAYLGSPILLSDVIVKPHNSLVLQSLHAQESNTRTNGDGFGVGWYAPSIDKTPALFTSVFPAWSNQNLLHLAAKVKSPAFFAHVRAASMGEVAQYNCHPFVYNEWMMMHNGTLAGFKRIKRHIRRLLDDDLYDWVKGTTDSEHLYALFLQQMKQKQHSNTLEVVLSALEETIQKILQLTAEFGDPAIQKASYFNLCLTDGKRLIATRYCSDKTLAPASLHYAIGDQFIIEKGHGEMKLAQNSPRCLLVSSEKLTQSSVNWQMIPAHHALLVDEAMQISLLEIE